MKEIKKPTQKTWYICWNEDKKPIHWSFVNSNQVLTSPHKFLDKYISEDEWRKVLINKGLTNEEIYPNEF